MANNTFDHTFRVKGEFTEIQKEIPKKVKNFKSELKKEWIDQLKAYWEHLKKNPKDNDERDVKRISGLRQSIKGSPNGDSFLKEFGLLLEFIKDKMPGS